MKVNQLAQKLAITPDTVRFYTRVGLLVPSRDPTNGYKLYNAKDLKRLRFILSARQLGFTVDDIFQILSVTDKGNSACPLVRRLIDQRLHETEQRFKDTVLLRDRMLSAIGTWEEKPDAEPTGEMICHLIEDFSGQPNEESPQ
ncbi:MAG: MerR family DNA-binding protein [Pseudomonadales bacterium]|nr:MerR family DNA-binding protein [Pseudomonadales bacterium]